MKKYMFSSIGRLRFLGFLEGTTLLVLVFIAVPLKYIWENHIVSQVFGPIHGGVFILFLLSTIQVHIANDWKFFRTTWKLVLACFIPFGTFYIDAKILRSMHEKEAAGAGV
jgi:integral membrane protein